MNQDFTSQTCSITLYRYCPWCGRICMSGDMDSTDAVRRHEPHECPPMPMEFGKREEVSDE